MQGDKEPRHLANVMSLVSAGATPERKRPCIEYVTGVFGVIKEQCINYQY